MFRHPKYYKELRKLRNNSDQVISDEASTEATSVRPGPGLSGKQQAASTSKRQATSKGKPQATSKRQASE
jgi:hypothetical protein